MLKLYKDKNGKLQGKIVGPKPIKVNICGNCIITGAFNKVFYKKGIYYDVINKTRIQKKRLIAEIVDRYHIKIHAKHKCDFKPGDVIELEPVASNKSRWVFNDTGEQSGNV